MSLSAWLRRLLSLQAKAERPMIYQGEYPVTEIILHTSATGPEWWHGKTVEQMRDEIDRWHKQRGWRGIGYHGVFAPDGSFAAGRPFTQQGAHVKERNRGTLGFCLVPIREVDAIRRFDDYYTAAQRHAVRAKIRAVSEMTDLRRVSGHNSYTNLKTCPGFKVESEAWLP